MAKYTAGQRDMAGLIYRRRAHQIGGMAGEAQLTPRFCNATLRLNFFLDPGGVVHSSASRKREDEVLAMEQISRSVVLSSRNVTP
jgi:hypothetical protein